MENRKLFYGFLVVFLITVILVSSCTQKDDTTIITQEINSFDDCAKAGYPILESYPRQCKIPDGGSFIEDLRSVQPSSQVPDESKYCVNYLGNPEPDGSCSTIEIEARKCNNIGDCTATCSMGCVNKNWDFSGRNDCEAIPQYECECINSFCQIEELTPVPPSDQGVSNPQCGIENCHGLDITCGANVPERCTALYQLGDRCRQFASCGIIDGSCGLVKSAEFDECKSCVDKCAEDFKDDVIQNSNCESKCGE